MDTIKTFNDIWKDVLGKDYDYQRDRMKIASDLSKDLVYISEHFNRTRLSRYHIVPVPILFQTGDGFLRKLFSFNHMVPSEKEITRVLDTIEISKRLMEPLKDDPTEKDLQILKEWSDYLKAYYEINLREWVGSFSGSSGICHDMEKRFPK